MEMQTAMLCKNCKKVLNSQDAIFGTSCGHLYHFDCLRECHAQSTKCSHCDAYKPFVFKMFLDYGESPLSWEHQAKTIALHNELEETRIKIAYLEQRYKVSEDSVQRSEGNLKKLKDALDIKTSTVSDLEDKLVTLEKLNKFLAEKLELLTKNSCNTTTSHKSHQQVDAHCNKAEEKYFCDSGVSKGAIAKSTQLSTDSIKFKSLRTQGTNENPHNVTDEFKKENNKENAVNLNSFNKQNYPDVNSHGNDGITTQSNGRSTGASSKVLICNYPINDLKTWSTENNVIYLASKMKISLSLADINKVATIKNKLNTATVMVEFSDVRFKNEFLKNKNLLEGISETRTVYIKDA